MVGRRCTGPTLRLLLHRQLSAIDLRAVRDVERAVVRAGEDARRQRLVFVDFGKHSAGTAGPVEDLYAEVARYVDAAHFVDRHFVVLLVYGGAYHGFELPSGSCRVAIGT